MICMQIKPNYDAAAEVCALNLEELESLARKTRLLINTVGPYHLYSSPVVEACAKIGTHYLDVLVLSNSE